MRRIKTIRLRLWADMKKGAVLRSFFIQNNKAVFTKIAIKHCENLQNHNTMHKFC